jgi:F-box and WD-40 domain protein 1/11
MQNAAAPPTNQQPMPPAVGAGAVPNPPPAAGAANTAAHHHHHHHHHAHHVNAPTSSRVFKLQFDARRIICCSQDPTIVGWDFANGDKDLIQASQFFSESG